jgi:hypothetical protein
MAAMPELAPSKKNRILETTSVISSVVYNVKQISYRTFDASSSEILHLVKKPSAITIDGESIPELSGENEIGWTWKPLEQGGGVLEIRKQGSEVIIML